KREELQGAADIQDRKHFRKSYIDPLISFGLLLMTMPDNPNSPNQRYKTTQEGAAFLKKVEEENKQ
ncbi:MAG: transcriptional regulator, partial [Dethiobacteria bacterium]|nr:transcriptional regulator [Dethiobacteria bacterium]